MKKLFILLSFLIMALCFTSQAKADSSWTFTVGASFTGNYMMDTGYKAQYDGGGGLVRESVDYMNNANPNIPASYARLSWGMYAYDDGRPYLSHLDLRRANVAESYTIGDDPLMILEFVHTNTDLPSIIVNGVEEDLPYPKLIEIFLSFTFSNAEEGIAYTHVVPFELGFVETNNNSGLPNDIFFFLPPTALNAYIALEGEYGLSIVSGFSEMDQSSPYYQLAIDSLGVAPGTELWGWETREGRETRLPISFRIEHIGTDTPEPASMLFLGGSLAGFGLLRRYRMKRKQNA